MAKKILTGSVAEDIINNYTESNTVPYEPEPEKGPKEQHVQTAEAREIRDASEEPFYTLKEAAEKMKVSLRTLMRYTKEGRVKTIRLSPRKIYIPQSELTRLFQVSDPV